MKKLFSLLLIIIMITTNPAVLAEFSYSVSTTQTIYSPGTYIVAEIKSTSNDWFTVEIFKGDVTLMSLPLHPELGDYWRFLIPANWENGTDYVLRAGRGADIASVSFEIKANSDSAIYALEIDKTTVRVGETLVLSGTSNVKDATVQYSISTSGGGFIPKTGKVTVANNKFECTVDIDSSYTEGRYVVRVGDDTVFSNECIFSVVNADAERVKTPTASPNGKTFVSSQSVVLSCATEGATVYYTANGTTPTVNSTQYISEITLASTTTIKAIAVKEGMLNSAVLTETYTKDSGGHGGGGGGGSKVVPPSLTPAPELTPVPTINKFTDINEEDWFYTAVKFTVDNALFNGISENEFSPEAQMTRAMIITILARYAGIDTAGGEQWWSKAVEWGIESGITDGTNLEGNLTREQLVVLLWRYAGNPSGTGVFSSFSDQNQIGDWAVVAMGWAVDTGLISGYPDNTINPKGSVTRAEVATIIYRYDQLM